MSEKRLAPRRAVSPLSLRQLVPPGWQDDPPAFPGDPLLDWESGPEPPAKGDGDRSDHQGLPRLQKR